MGDGSETPGRFIVRLAVGDLGPVSAEPSCRIFIVYRHALFAQGVRSVLERQSTARIVGMDDDAARATTAIAAAQPDVILVEEPEDRGATWRFLDAAAASRIVTLSLDHAYATVYDHRRAAATDASDLVRAIRGEGALDSASAQASPRSEATQDSAAPEPKIGGPSSGISDIEGETDD